MAVSQDAVLRCAQAVASKTCALRAGRAGSGIDQARLDRLFRHSHQGRCRHRAEKAVAVGDTECGRFTSPLGLVGDSLGYEIIAMKWFDVRDALMRRDSAVQYRRMGAAEPRCLLPQWMVVSDVDTCPGC